MEVSTSYTHTHSLLQASKIGDMDVVSRLVSAKANVNIKCHYNDDIVTPLLLASINNHSSLVCLFVGALANIHAKTINGMTALMFASRYGSESIVLLLLRAGANVDDRDHRGWTALMHACASNNTHTIRILVNAGADVNATSVIGQTALMAAIQTQNSLPFMVMLIRCGADVNAVAHNQHTPLLYAYNTNRIDVGRILLKASLCHHDVSQLSCEEDDTHTHTHQSTCACNGVCHCKELCVCMSVCRVWMMAVRDGRLHWLKLLYSHWVHHQLQHTHTHTQTHTQLSLAVGESLHIKTELHTLKSPRSCVSVQVADVSDKTGHCYPYVVSPLWFRDELRLNSIMVAIEAGHDDIVRWLVEEARIEIV